MRPGAATSIPAFSGSWLHSTSPNQLSTAAAQAPKPTHRPQSGAAAAARAVALAPGREGKRLAATGATCATGVAGGGATGMARQQPAAGPAGAALCGAAGLSQQAAEILQQQQHLMQQPAPPSSGLSLFKSLYQADVPPLWQPSPSTSSRAPGKAETRGVHEKQPGGHLASVSLRMWGQRCKRHHAGCSLSLAPLFLVFTRGLFS